jgi:hypothetical protein
MSLVIDLPADVEARLERAAQQQGKAKEEIVGDLVAQHFPARSGKEILARLRAKGALGAFKDRPDDWAQQLRHESNTRGRGNP